MNWDTIEDSEGVRLERAEVPGGWLYRSTTYREYRDICGTDQEDVTSTALAFVPRPVEQP